MKNKTLLILFLLPLFSVGQKVDLDRFTFTSQFRSLPAVWLDSSYRTYNVTVESTKLMQSFLNELTPEKSVVVDGWRLLTQQGHVTFKVRFEDILPESFNVRERVEIQKDKAGRQIGTRTTYYQEVVYTFAASAEMNDYKGANIMNFNLADRSYKQVYKSPEFALRPLAEAYFMMNALNITGQLYKNCVNKSIRYLSSEATDNFGYGEVTVTDFMWILDSKKHPEYMAHRNAFLKLKDVLFTITASKPIDGIREELKPVIKYFDDIKKKYPGTSKHDRKLRYASYFNLAVLYYYLDDPQAMMKEASGLVLNDFDSKDGRAFEATAVRLKELFERTKMTTRHFPVDINSYKGPFENAVSVNK